MATFVLKKEQLKELMEFKKFFHGKDNTVYLLVKKGRDGTDAVTELYGSVKSNLDAIRDKNETGVNVYMLINSTGTKTRRAEDITRVNSVFIDFDRGTWRCKNVKTFLGKFPVKPGLVLRTSPGNFHVYWRVKDMPVGKFKKLQKMLAAKFAADPAVCDLPRVMRMPGTINWNHEPPFAARTVYIDQSGESIPWRRFVKMTFGADQAKELLEDAVPTAFAAVNPPAIIEEGKRGENDEESESSVDRMKSALNCIPFDQRDVWITVAMALKNGLGEDGLQMFKDWSMKSSKYDEVELERQWNSLRPGGGITIGTLFWLAKDYSATLSLNAEGNHELSTQLEIVKLFARHASGLLRHSEADNAWYGYQFGRWSKSWKIAEQVVTDYLGALRTAAAISGNAKYRDLVERYQSSAAARDILRAAESNRELSITPDMFDRHPNFLNVQARPIPHTVPRYGVVVLDKNRGKLATSQDMVLKIAGAVYDRGAKCPLWVKFLSDATGGDNELVEFLQLAVGYTLYGHAKEQVMFILIGSAGNGKGVFARTISAVLGEYAATLQNSLLKPGAINANQPSPALMQLNGRRMWACAEVPKGMMLDEALVKQLTGGDMISARHLYGGQQEFLPVGKLWLTVNDMPRVRHDDKGMWRRIIAIPFDVKFFGTSRDDKNIEVKLKEELPGILQWALTGAKRYAQLGELPRPKVVRDLIHKLRGDVNTVGNWIEHACRTGDDLRLQSQRAYDSYRQYMQSEKTALLNQREFKAEMERQGYAHKASNRYNYFDSISLKGE